MKKFFSTNYSDTAFNIGIFALRAGAGLLMMPHGYNKMIHFFDRKEKFMNFLGMGSSATLALVIFAELFCALFFALGLFTRAAALVLTILASVIVFKVDKGDIFGDAEHPMLFLLAFFTVLLVGPGKFSIDRAMGK